MEPGFTGKQYKSPSSEMFKLQVMVLKAAVFRVVAPFSLAVYGQFRGACCLHHQGDYF
jgi:hypothetical protein